MRGLVTAGRAVRLERFACLEVERRRPMASAAHSCVAGRSSRCCHRSWSTKQVGGGASPRGRPGTSTSRPARGRSRRWRRCASCGGRRSCPSGGAAAGCPASPRARAAGLASAHRSRMVLPTAVGGAVVPGGLDQQPAGVGVAGLGDRALDPGLAPEECSRGHQPDEGADGGAGEPVPVADLDRQREPGQRRDPAQAAQPAHDRGELAVGGHRRDRGVEPVPAGGGGQRRRRSRSRRSPGSPAGRRTAAGAATRRGRRSRPSRRSRRCPGAAAASTAGAGPASDHRGSPPGPGPGPGPPPARRWAPRTAVISSSRSSRARCTASRASVLTRSPRAGAASTAPPPRTGSRPRSAPGPARTRSGRPRRSPPPGRAARRSQDRMCSCDGVSRSPGTPRP